MSILNQFKNQHIMVFGDLIADIYEFGIIRRLSREAPIPIVEYESDRFVPGGAGNVVANLTSLEGKAVPVSVVGKDEAGAKIVNYFKEKGIETAGLLSSAEVFTTTKTRILAQGEHTVRQQILRLDRLPSRPLQPEVLNQLWDAFVKIIPETGAVIISDYHMPVFPESFIMNLVSYAIERRKKIIVDSRHRILKYQGVTLLTPNRSEAEEAVGFELKTRASLEEAGKIILEKTGAAHLLITLGDEGMVLFTPGEPGDFIPVYNKQEVFDVSGAGDTVVAALTLGLLSGMSPSEAANFANIAAGLVVRKLGTATVTIGEIKDDLNLKGLSYPFIS